MLWICAGCGAGYAVDAPRCPQCGVTDWQEQGEDMPKITNSTGPSNAGDESAVPVVLTLEADAEVIPGPPDPLSSTDPAQLENIDDDPDPDDDLTS